MKLFFMKILFTYLLCVLLQNTSINTERGRETKRESNEKQKWCVGWNRSVSFIVSRVFCNSGKTRFLFSPTRHQHQWRKPTLDDESTKSLILLSVIFFSGGNGKMFRLSFNFLRKISNGKESEDQSDRWYLWPAEGQAWSLWKARGGTAVLHQKASGEEMPCGVFSGGKGAPVL